VLTAIGLDFERLASKSSSDREKLEAIKYLGHWVGDIHQPLHVSYSEDRGGNSIKASSCRNLHAAWDTCLVNHAVGKDVPLAVDALLKGISVEKREAWTKSVPREWANETFAIMRDPKMRYCIQRGASCDMPDPPYVVIDLEYLKESRLVIREQLQKAGARLAHMLDRALGAP